MGENNLPTRLATMRGRWETLTQTHIIVGGGCSCGHGMGHLDIGGFASLITSYLRTKYADEGRIALTSVIGADTDGETSDSAMDRLFDSSAKGEIPLDDIETLLIDLEKALGSFDELHKGH